MLPGVAWVGLLLALIPVVQGWVAVQWPEASYPITALVLALLAAVGKWLELRARAPVQETGPTAEVWRPGEVAETLPPVREGRLRAWLLG